MNQVSLAGRLVRDPEFKYLESGIAVANFRLAVKNYSKSNPNGVIYVPCCTYSKSAEIAGEHLSQGDQILFSNARLNISNYEKNGITKYFTQIIVPRFEFGSKAKHTNKTEEIPF